MQTDTAPTLTPREKFRGLHFSFIINLFFLILLGLMIHSPSWLYLPSWQPSILSEYAGENGPALLIALLMMGIVGLLLSLVWKPKERLITIILCLLNIFVIAISLLALFGLISSHPFGQGQTVLVNLLLMLAVLAIGFLNVKTLIFLDIIGAITLSNKA